MDVRGQISFEFMVAISAVMLVFLLAFFAYSERQENFILEQGRGRAQLLADKLGNAIDSVFIAGKGAQAIVLLEEDIDVNIAAGPNVVRAWYGNNFVSAWVLAENIDLGGGLFGGGSYLVKNSGVSIDVTPA